LKVVFLQNIIFFCNLVDKELVQTFYFPRLYMRDYRKENEIVKAEEAKAKEEEKQKTNERVSQHRERIKSGQIEEEKKEQSLPDTGRKILENLRWHLDESKGKKLHDPNSQRHGGTC
jgi:hypothetical protein